MSETAKPKKHTVMLDHRARLIITGAEDVNGFNEEAIAGLLIVKGSNLHIDKLSLETGDLSVDGKIDSLQYIGSDNSRSRLRKLFR